MGQKAHQETYYDHAKDGSVSSHRKKRRSLIIGAIATVIIIIAIILGVVLGLRAVRNNAYPNYTALNYKLVKEYSGSNFFSDFDYFHTYDPAQGFVHYADPDYAKTYNLTFATDTSAVIRVDTTDKNATTGRLSARLMTKETYNNGLFIFDVAHSPTGCATWPALWLSDMYNWPQNGEIDVMESVNIADKNQVALHTTKNCKMERKREQTGKILQKDCYNATNENAGCGVEGAAATIGTNFNQNGGGIYAMELRNEGIRVWFFPRSNIPSDLLSATALPAPASWGTPTADFPSTDCNIAQHFRNQSIIANIDLCGQWAGKQDVFSETCPGKCEDYVAKNPTAFADAFWQFNSWKVYQA